MFDKPSIEDVFYLLRNCADVKVFLENILQQVKTGLNSLKFRLKK